MFVASSSAVEVVFQSLRLPAQEEEEDEADNSKCLAASAGLFKDSALSRKLPPNLGQIQFVHVTLLGTISDREASRLSGLRRDRSRAR